MQVGELFDQVGVAWDAQHRRHHQVAGREAVLQVLASIQAVGQLGQPPLQRFHHRRPARLGPVLVGVEEVDLDQAGHARFDGIQRREDPRLGARPPGRIDRHQDLGPLGDVQDDRPGFEHRDAVRFECRHLREGLMLAIGVRLLLLLCDQPRFVGDPRLFQRPADAQVPDQPLGEGRDPTECTHSGHGGSPLMGQVVVSALTI